MGSAIILLYAAPLIAWLVMRFRSGSAFTRKFTQGFLAGAIGFYAAILALYCSLIWGVR